MGELLPERAEWLVFSYMPAVSVLLMEVKQTLHPLHGQVDPDFTYGLRSESVQFFRVNKKGVHNKW